LSDTGRLADELYRIVKNIVGDIDNMCPVNFEPDESPDDSMKKVAAAIQRSAGKKAYWF